MELLEELKVTNNDLTIKLRNSQEEIEKNFEREREWKKEEFYLKQKIESLKSSNCMMEKDVADLRISNDEFQQKYSELQYSLIDIKAQLTAYEQKVSDDKKIESFECTPATSSIIFFSTHTI